MTLAGLLTTVAADPALTRAVESLGTPELDLAAPSGFRPFAVASIAAAGRPVLAVTATERETEDLVTALQSLLPPQTVVDYPAWETLPHERLSPRADTVGRRLAVMRRLRHPRLDDPTVGPVSVVVAPIRSLLQPQAAGLGDLVPVELQAGEDADFEAIVRALSDIAYTRVDMVERRGEFAVRGGILDVFPPTEDHPVRVEFWGDTVEEVRYFAVADQRSLEVWGSGRRHAASSC
jgi:transcription-repair coupling factor (superfamily II helicase)